MDDPRCLSRQRVSLINAIRSHMAEFGVIAAAGPQHVGSLIERISHPATPLPDMVRGALSILADQLVARSKQIIALEAQMRKHCREEPEAARLPTIPNVGPITTSAILAGVPDIRGFKSGRDFAAWRLGATAELERRQRAIGPDHEDG